MFTDLSAMTVGDPVMSSSAPATASVVGSFALVVVQLLLGSEPATAVAVTAGTGTIAVALARSLAVHGQGHLSQPRTQGGRRGSRR